MHLSRNGGMKALRNQQELGAGLSGLFYTLVRFSGLCCTLRDLAAFFIPLSDAFVLESQSHFRRILRWNRLRADKTAGG